MKSAHDLPGTSGLPLLGETHEAFLFKQQFYLDRYHLHNSYFKTSILNKNTIVLFGKDACSKVLDDREKIFSSRKGWGLLEEFLGHGILLKDGNQHRNSKKIIGYAFSEISREKISEVVLNSSNHAIEIWNSQSHIFLFRGLRKFTFEVIFNLVFGTQVDTKEIDYLEPLFSDLVDGQLDVFRINTLQTSYGRALKAKELIFDHVLKKIKSEYKTGRLKNSILGFILNKNNSDFINDPLTLEELAVELIQILFAGYETSAIMIYWTIFSIYKNPYIQKDIKEYARELRLDIHESFNSCRILNYCLLETERLFPPVYAIPRGLLEDCYFDDYRIPKSWNVVLSPLITHRLESLFPQANMFLPFRFENNTITNCLFGFGGGKHKCLGKEIAKLEAQVLILALNKEFNYTLLPDLSFDRAVENSSSYLNKLFLKLKKI